MSTLNLVVEPGKQGIVMTRVFDAPRDLVFKTFTDPNLIPQWWGPKSVTTTVDKMEVRPGGLWRFVQRDADGSNEYAFHGVYHDISAPEWVIYTFEWEGMPGHVLLETIAFEERDGKTTMTDTSVFQTVEDRDGMVQSGMEEGATESMDRFAELLKTRAWPLGRLSERLTIIGGEPWLQATVRPPPRRTGRSSSPAPSTRRSSFFRGS